MGTAAKWTCDSSGFFALIDEKGGKTASNIDLSLQLANNPSEPGMGTGVLGLLGYPIMIQASLE